MKRFLLYFLLFLNPLFVHANSIDDYYKYRTQGADYQKKAVEYEVKKDLEQSRQFYNKSGDAYFKQGFGD